MISKSIPKIKISISMISMIALTLITASNCQKLQETVPEISNKEFDTLVLNASNQLSVIFLGAEWCGHCTNFKPTFQRIFLSNQDKSSSTGETLKFFTCFDQGSELFQRFKIQSFPTILAFKGKEMWTFEGQGGRNYETVVKWYSSLEAGTGGAIASGPPSQFFQMLEAIKIEVDRNPKTMYTLMAILVFLMIVSGYIGAKIGLYIRKKWDDEEEQEYLEKKRKFDQARNRARASATGEQQQQEPTQEVPQVDSNKDKVE